MCGPGFEPGCETITLAVCAFAAGRGPTKPGPSLAGGRHRSSRSWSVSSACPPRSRSLGWPTTSQESAALCAAARQRPTAVNRGSGVLFVEAKRYRRSREAVGTKSFETAKPFRDAPNLRFVNTPTARRRCPPLSSGGVDARLEAIPSESPSPSGFSLSRTTAQTFGSHCATRLSQSVLSLGCGRFSETERRATTTSAITVSSVATNNSPVPAESPTRPATSA